MGRRNGPSALPVYLSLFLSMAALALAAAAYYKASGGRIEGLLPAFLADQSPGDREGIVIRDDDDATLLRRLADSAKEIEDRAREGEAIGALQTRIEEMRERLAEAGQTAAPALRARLGELGESLESASDAIRRQARDLPDRLSALSESARSLYARYRHEREAARELEDEEP